MKCHLQLLLLVFLASVFLVDKSRADKRVLMIGIDGGGGSYVQAANTPNIDALAANGTVRYDFYNEGGLIPGPPSGYGSSGVNWSTINTGAAASSHGVSDNSFSGNNFDDAPHWFKHIKDHDASLYTASIVHWAPINDQILPDQYANLESEHASDTSVRTAVVDLLNTGDPDAIFVQFDEVDGAGHSNGWGSSGYFNGLETVDSLIGDVMSALNSRPGVINGSEDWLVLITADHVAKFGATGHSASQGPMNWEVPFLASSPSVPNGIPIEQGTSRDLTTTALWHLGIDPFATTVEGIVVAIPRAPNGIEGDVNQDGVISGNGQGPAASDDVTAFC